MKVIKTDLPGVCLIEPRVFCDGRGYFFETYHARRYLEHGVAESFVQDNVSLSTCGVLRGLHYQIGQPQAKLVMVLSGEIHDVVVDIRRGSPTFGKWLRTAISSDNHRQLLIPKGFAHGFCVISETATVLYKCSDFYAPNEERGIRWNDPALNIAWGVESPTLSEKDRSHPSINEMAPEDLPLFGDAR